jgi:hypothetical protein
MRAAKALDQRLRRPLDLAADGQCDRISDHGIPPLAEPETENHQAAKAPRVFVFPGVLATWR